MSSIRDWDTPFGPSALLEAQLGNTSADKDYQPSGISKAEEAALDWYPFDPMEDDSVTRDREHFVFGYDQALEDILPAAQALVDAVERYVKQRCLRSELLNKKDDIKKLLK